MTDDVKDKLRALLNSYSFDVYALGYYTGKLGRGSPKREEYLKNYEDSQGELITGILELLDK